MWQDLSNIPPYPIHASEGPVSYTFTTDTGIEYLIVFDDKTSDYSREDIGDSIVYEYQFYPASNIDREIYDTRIMATIMDSILKVVSNAKNAILYICENGDKKGAARARYFDAIFKSNAGDGYIKIDGTIKESRYNEELTYISLIVNKDNPYRDQINYTFQQVLFHVDLSKLPDI